MICFSSSLRMTPTHIHSPMPVNGSGNFYSVPWRTWLRLSDQSMATSALIDITCVYYPVSRKTFWRIGRPLVDLMRGFDLSGLCMTPMRHVRYSKEYPVRFVSLKVLLPNAKLLVLVAALTEECKKWHPEIPDLEIALPHFIQWFRRNTTE